VTIRGDLLRVGRVRVARPARSDAYPEGVKYPDTGCEVAPACLSCPLEVCIHDSHGQAKVRLRDLRIAKAGGTNREIAATVGVSVRTVCRARART